MAMSHRIGGILISAAIAAVGSPLREWRENVAQLADEPQDVQVAGRVVGEARGGVEGARAGVGQLVAPTR